MENERNDARRNRYATTMVKREWTYSIRNDVCRWTIYFIRLIVVYTYSLNFKEYVSDGSYRDYLVTERVTRIRSKILSKLDIFGTKTRHKKGIVMLMRDNQIFRDLRNLTKTERSVMDFIFSVMAEDLNTVIIGGETKENLLFVCGVTEATLKKIVSVLTKSAFIEKTAIPNEYIVNPMLAISGNYFEVMANYKRIENELRTAKGFKPI